MRSQREKNFTAQVSRRLSDFAFGQLGITPRQLSDTLGCDPSMIYRVRRGETLPDLAKLVDLWSFARNKGVPLNFEWLLTGQASFGMPEIQSLSHLDALNLIQRMDEEAVRALLPVLKLLGASTGARHSDG